MQQPSGGWSTRATAAFIIAAVFVLGGGGSVWAAKEGDVIINEVMWDGKEYVEFYNTSDEEIDVSGWSLWKQKSTEEDEYLIYDFKAGTVIGVGDEGYFLLESTEAATEVIGDDLASLGLLTGGLLLTLKQADGGVIDSANWFGVWFAGKNTPEGIAMERVEGATVGTVSDSWYSSTGYVAGRNGTPGAKNSAPFINSAPEAVISGSEEVYVGEEAVFTAEDSSDPDEADDLIYAWTFSDGDTSDDEVVEKTFDELGKYTVELSVSDGVLSDEAPVYQIEVKKKTYSSAIVINEVVPNIAGDDKLGEFVELKNTGSEQVDLSGWRLEYGSLGYTIKDATITARGYEVFDYATTKRYLTNAGATVRLVDPNGDVVSSVNYPGKMKEDYSYSRNESGDFEISQEATKGKANEFVWEDEEEESEEDSAEEELGSGEGAGEVAGLAAKAVVLAKVREVEEGQVVTVEGVVSTPPGVLGERIIYLAGSGIQIYFYAADWPDLVLGETVRITGEYGVSGGEARIKVEDAGDIEQVATGDAPVAHEIKTGEIGEDQEGWLVTIQGEVSRTSGDTFYVDDGSGEIKVFIKESTLIDKPKMKKGEAVTVTGVVSQTKSGYRILPRFQEDVRLGRVAGMTSFPATGQQANLGEEQLATAQMQWRSDTLFVLWLVVAYVLVTAWRAKEPLFG